MPGQRLLWWGCNAAVPVGHHTQPPKQRLRVALSSNGCLPGEFTTGKEELLPTPAKSWMLLFVATAAKDNRLSSCSLAAKRAWAASHYAVHCVQVASKLIAEEMRGRRTGYVPADEGVVDLGLLHLPAVSDCHSTWCACVLECMCTGVLVC